VTDATILLGTSSFRAAGWEGSFYPRGIRPVDCLSFYAEHFSTVEVDSTFYACPTARTVTNWYQRTPRGFIFSVKVPQTVTHEKLLVGCDAELAEFLTAMDLLGEKLGPIVLQFPFLDRWRSPTPDTFLAVLAPFLKKLPKDRKFAVEIRNRAWLEARLTDLLREHRVALVLQDLSTMPGPVELARRFDPITTDWTYIRWLGDRKAIEKLTQTWDKTVVDRTAELKSWVDYCDQVRKRGVLIYAYANNHYAGHSPTTIKQFRDLWRERGLPELPGPAASGRRQTSLFPA
jgi:uncharacterized protein YecE (DUF72 family)